MVSPFTPAVITSWVALWPLLEISYVAQDTVLLDCQTPPLSYVQRNFSCCGFSTLHFVTMLTSADFPKSSGGTWDKFLLPGNSCARRANPLPSRQLLEHLAAPPTTAAPGSWRAAGGGVRDLLPTLHQDECFPGIPSWSESSFSKQCLERAIWFSAIISNVVRGQKSI